MARRATPFLNWHSRGQIPAFENATSPEPEIEMVSGGEVLLDNEAKAHAAVAPEEDAFCHVQSGAGNLGSVACDFAALGHGPNL